MFGRKGHSNGARCVKAFDDKDKEAQSRREKGERNVCGGVCKRKEGQVEEMVRK